MLRCSGCGQENPGGFRFCGACGSSLADAPHQPVGEERKVVTVLFCDLVGFTSRSDRADPEDVGAMLRPFHTRLRGEIERVGGTLDKLIGDAVMAVFGVPAVHEDDPERAVRCALRMLDAIAELNQAHPVLELAVRIGINTGEALVALDRGADSEGVVGDVVNTAARLQGVAPVNGVVVGEATWRATRMLFAYEQLAPVQVKGKAEPVPIWQVLGARSRPGVDVAEQLATPLIGRGEELATLQRCYRQAFSEHAVQLVTLLGEPGVGKSRLVREFAGFADAQPELVAWRRGQCLSYGEAVGFWASARSSRPRRASWSPTTRGREPPNWTRRSALSLATPRNASGSRRGWPRWWGSRLPPRRRPAGTSLSWRGGVSSSWWRHRGPWSL